MVLALIASGGDFATGQDDIEPLRLDGLVPTGGRSSVTESWGVLQFGVENRSDTARLARVVVFYTSRPDVQYTRDIWVPAHSRVTSWVTVGPAPEHSSASSREISYQLFDRTDGTNRASRSNQPDRLLSRAVPYRKREPTTAVYTAALQNDDETPDAFSIPDSPAADTLRFAKVFRHARGLSEWVSIVRDRYLPPTPDAFDGIDLFVLAGNRLAADTIGSQALRHWLHNGGTLWIPLDRVDPAVVAPILGDGLRFRVVGRTSLTTVRLRSAKQDRSLTQQAEFDRPVELVRVTLSGKETVLIDANNWPAAFSQPVGRGRVIFTTLGPNGWYRPRTPRDPPSRFELDRDLPVPNDAMEYLVQQLYPEPEPETLGTSELAPMLAAEIGYEVIGRRAATGMLVAFLVGVVVLAIVLRRSRAPEWIGLGAPAVAVITTAAFIAAGAKSRQAVPPTAAAVAVVTVSPDSREEEWRGLFAVYNPSSGIIELGTKSGGRVELGRGAQEGAPRRRVESDLDAWSWENLSFPAGVQVGPLSATRRTNVSVVAQFGPEGLEGRLYPGKYRNPTDAVLQTRSGSFYSVRLGQDGMLRIGTNDALPPNQFLAGAVLTDRQQRRQEVYRRLFANARTTSRLDSDRLFVWAETDELPFSTPVADRRVGTVLLTIPVRYEQTGNTLVTVPSGFLTLAAITDGRSYRPKFEGTEPVQMRLRFELPSWDRGFTAERAILTARVRTPSRKFAVAGHVGAQQISLLEQLAPSGLLRAEITDPRLLRADADGGLFLDVIISERIGTDGREAAVGVLEPQLKWEIDTIGLEVVGRLAAE